MSTNRLVIFAAAYAITLHGALSQSLWENSTTKDPVKVEFGPSYTVKGDIRVQKIYTSESTQFPHVFLPEAPLEVLDNDPEMSSAVPEKPMRIVVLREVHGDKQMLKQLEKAEGKHVEITFFLTTDINDELLEKIGLMVEKITVLGDAKNSG
jgi:hypothetical protein